MLKERHFETQLLKDGLQPQSARKLFKPSAAAESWRQIELFRVPLVTRGFL
jgi:hypothetical protein